MRDGINITVRRRMNKKISIRGGAPALMKSFSPRAKLHMLSRLLNTRQAGERSSLDLPRGDGERSPYWESPYTEEWIKGESKMNWILSRMEERTTWDGIALVAIGGISLFMPHFAEWAAYAAIAWGVWTMLMKEE
jgi:hypothetical protein